MNTIEVLIATINKDPKQLPKSLNLQTPAVIASQSDTIDYQEFLYNDSRIKVISFIDRGVSKNRNRALMHSSADICIIGDDDLIYSDNYPQMVQKAFDDNPKADIIIFHIVNLMEPNKRIIKKTKRVNILNFARYGACRVAFRRTSVLKSNIWFSILFGGGALYSSGEDTLFLREALRKGLKIYTYPLKIADAKQNESSWFKGYNDKFFFDKGILIASMFPFFKYLFAMKFAYGFSRASNYTYFHAYRLMCMGIKSFNSMSFISKDSSK